MIASTIIKAFTGTHLKFLNLEVTESQCYWEVYKAHISTHKSNNA
jgi:hypothetical protein